MRRLAEILRYDAAGVLTAHIIPSVESFWDTASRPAAPVIGQRGFNTNLSAVEVWDGTAWNPASDKPDVVLAGAVPADADVATWANGNRGVGIGTDGSRWWMYKDSGGHVKSTVLQ